MAKAFGIPIFFSWREGGFVREMTKHKTKETSRVWFETPTGIQSNTPRGSKEERTRMLFPQLSANLNVRWCSAYLKIDVGASAIANQDRFSHANLLFVTGERAEESAGRAKYAVSEPHKTTTKHRSVTQWRPVHAWTTQDVWTVIEQHKVNAHPCYHAGWGRCSCATCIFGNKDQWASLGAVSPGKLYLVSKYEREFSAYHGRPVTLRRDGKEILDFASTGTAYPAINPLRAKALNDTDYHDPIFLDDWEMPAGATADLTGPC